MFVPNIKGRGILKSGQKQIAIAKSSIMREFILSFTLHQATGQEFIFYPSNALFSGQIYHRKDLNPDQPPCIMSVQYTGGYHEYGGGVQYTWRMS